MPDLPIHSYCDIDGIALESLRDMAAVRMTPAEARAFAADLIATADYYEATER